MEQQNCSPHGSEETEKGNIKVRAKIYSSKPFSKSPSSSVAPSSTVLSSLFKF
jgi:hypothetical protein